MQRVAEFMEECARVVEAQETGFALRRLHEVEIVHNNRQNVSVELFLFAEIAHPGAAAFRRPCEIIADEERHRASVRRKHVEGARIIVIELEIETLAEAEAEQLLSGEEDRLDHGFELQIGLD